MIMRVTLLLDASTGAAETVQLDKQSHQANKEFIEILMKSVGDAL
jgi:hypothetical protein